MGHDPRVAARGLAEQTEHNSDCVGHGRGTSCVSSDLSLFPLTRSEALLCCAAFIASPPANVFRTKRSVRPEPEVRAESARGPSASLGSLPPPGQALCASPAVALAWARASTAHEHLGRFGLKAAAGKLDAKGPKGTERSEWSGQGEATGRRREAQEGCSCEPRGPGLRRPPQAGQRHGPGILPARSEGRVSPRAFRGEGPARGGPAHTLISSRQDCEPASVCCLQPRQPSCSSARDSAGLSGADMGSQGRHVSEEVLGL